MKLMLAAIFFFLAIGVFARQIGRREQAIVVGTAVLMSALYLSSLRFM
jgi:hypothetical protein